MVYFCQVLMVFTPIVICLDFSSESCCVCKSFQIMLNIWGKNLHFSKNHQDFHYILNRVHLAKLVSSLTWINCCPFFLSIFAEVASGLPGPFMYSTSENA